MDAETIISKQLHPQVTQKWYVILYDTNTTEL